jgi:hypothetical protein
MYALLLELEKTNHVNGDLFKSIMLRDIDMDIFEIKFATKVICMAINCFFRYNLLTASTILLRGSRFKNKFLCGVVVCRILIFVRTSRRQDQTSSPNHNLIQPLPRT